MLTLLEMEPELPGFDPTEPLPLPPDEVPDAPAVCWCLFCENAPALPGLYACAPCDVKNKAEEAEAYAKLVEANRAKKALKTTRKRNQEEDPHL